MFCSLAAEFYEVAVVVVGACGVMVCCLPRWRCRALDNCFVSCLVVRMSKPAVSVGRLRWRRGVKVSRPSACPPKLFFGAWCRWWWVPLRLGG